MESGTHVDGHCQPTYMAVVEWPTCVVAMEPPTLAAQPSPVGAGMPLSSSVVGMRANCCASVPLAVYIWMLVLLVLMAPRTSMT